VASGVGESGFVSFVPTEPHRHFRFHPITFFLLALAMALPFETGRPAESREMVFYFPGTHNVLPVTTLNHAEYLPLLRLMNLFTQIDRLKGKKNSLEIWFGNNVLEVRQDNKTVRLNNIRFKLSEPMRVVDGEWDAPVDFLNSVFPTLVNQSVLFQASGNRVFVGDVRPSTFTVRVDPLPGGAKLTVQFTHKIDLRTAARNGKWVFFLGAHPVEPLESSLSFQNPYLSDLQFDDRDGAPKLVLTPTSVGLDMFPSLTDGGTLLVAEVKKPGAAVAANAPPSAGSAQAPSVPSTQGQAPVQTPQAAGSAAAQTVLPVVVLDAGHGGNDSGARGQNGLLEKNLNFQIVSRVRLALLATNRYRVVLTRIGDADPSLNDREATANIVRPIAFISFHAGNLGAAIPRINVYTYMPSAPPDMSLPGNALFVPWREAQAPYAGQSLQLATALQQQLEVTTHDASSPPQSAPVRILRSVAAPAVAIEVGSLAPDTNPAPLTSSVFQQQLADGIVRALAQIQGGAS
jgi:N-acetylmuramoyl-L-alanine amidase